MEKQRAIEKNCLAFFATQSPPNLKGVLQALNLALETRDAEMHARMDSVSTQDKGPLSLAVTGSNKSLQGVDCRHPRLL